LIKVGLMIRLW